MAKLPKGSVCSLLRIKSLKQAAESFGVTKKVMQHFVYRNNISPAQIKHDYAVKILSELMATNTDDQMVVISGFSKTKVRRITKEIRSSRLKHNN